MSAIKFKLEVPNHETKNLEFKLESGDNKTLLAGLLDFQNEINTTLTHFVDKEKKLKEAGGKKKEEAAEEDAEEEEDGEDEADESVKNDKIIDEIKNMSKSKRLKGSE